MAADDDTVQITRIDRKEEILLQDLHRRIAAGTFDELDAANFWMQLRERTDDPWIREFGDFVGHRSRDKGEVFNRVYEMVSAMKNFTEGKEKELWEIFNRPIFFSEQLIDHINADLTAINLAALDRRAIKNLLLVTFFLLQDVLILDPTNAQREMSRKQRRAVAHEVKKLAVLQPSVYGEPGRERGVWITAMVELKPHVFHQIPVIQIKGDWFPPGGASTPRQVVRISFREHVIQVDVIR